MGYNFQNQHLTGQQRHMADKYVNDVKKQQQEVEKKKQPERKLTEEAQQSEHVELSETDSLCDNSGGETDEKVGE